MHENLPSDHAHLGGKQAPVAAAATLPPSLPRRILAWLINVSAAVVAFAGTGIACKNLLRDIPAVQTLLLLRFNGNDPYQFMMSIGMILVAIISTCSITQAVHGITCAMTERTILKRYPNTQPKA